jgi:hypothetical protein
MNTELNIPENKIASKETGFPDWLTHSNVWFWNFGYNILYEDKIFSFIVLTVNFIKTRQCLW